METEKQGKIVESLNLISQTCWKQDQKCILNTLKIEVPENVLEMF